MSRLELARWLRDHAHALNEPLNDGTDLTKEEVQSINVAMEKICIAAQSIEVGNQAAKQDLAWHERHGWGEFG